MRKLAIVALAVAFGLALGAGVAMATSGDTDPVEQDTDPGCPTSGDAICIDTSEVEEQSGQDSPIGAVVAAGGDPTMQEGYIFADGNGDNPDPLGGYVGVNSADEAILVGATDGHFHRAGGNSPLDPTELP